MSADATPVASIPKAVERLRETFNSGVTRSEAWRREQLQAAKKMLLEEREAIMDALRKDLHMDPLLCNSEVSSSVKEGDAMLDNLTKYMAPERRSVPVLQFPGSGKVVKDPLGVVLIIAPWNYPVSLLMKPLFGALAAGNCVVLKPSEVTVNVNNVLGRIVKKYFDPSVVTVVQGGVAETTAVLKERFDKIMYTGNGTVAKIVMKAAAEHLTPVLLELGGKTPCIIDESADLKVAIPRICWGKYTNAGQTCVAPDYVLVHRSKMDDFVKGMKETVAKFYTDDPKQSDDLARVVNSRHTERIANLIKTSKGTVAYGGDVDVASRYVAPTLIVQPDLASPIMNEEIFGPVLPVFPVDSTDDAVKFVNARDKPLALYVFAKKKSVADDIFSRTTSGGGGHNECLMHVICENLPFGGVGPSGMGAYNGAASFDAFSHHKSILSKPLTADPSLRFPPYTEKKLSWLLWLNGIKGKHLKYALLTTLAAAGAIGTGIWLNSTRDE